MVEISLSDHAPSLSDHAPGIAAQIHRPAKEAIARALQAPYAEVERLYEQELELLAAEARIMQFLGVTVGKRVRMHLRQHS